MNRGKNYKDKEKWRETCLKQKRKYYRKTAYKYPPRPWSIAEDRAVLLQNISDGELSSQIQRSVAAIQMRRSRLKRFETMVEL